MVLKIIITIINFLFIFGISLQAQYKEEVRKPVEFETFLKGGRWVVLDDFDNTTHWDLTPPAELKQYENTSPEDVKTPKVLIKTIPTGVDFRIIGGRFLRYIDNKGSLGFKIIFPVNQSVTVPLFTKQPYELEGYCKKLSFWLLGRGRPEIFGIILEDYKGRSYYIDVTKLDFLGWKKFEVNIPPTIPQTYQPYPKYPRRKIITLKGFTVTHIADRTMDEFILVPLYIYIDHLEAFLDDAIETYPGIEIQDNW